MSPKTQDTNTSSVNCALAENSTRYVKLVWTENERESEIVEYTPDMDRALWPDGRPLVKFVARLLADGGIELGNAALAAEMKLRRDYMLLLSDLVEGAANVLPPEDVTVTELPVSEYSGATGIVEYSESDTLAIVSYTAMDVERWTVKFHLDSQQLVPLAVDYDNLPAGRRLEAVQRYGILTQIRGILDLLRCPCPVSAEAASVEADE